MGATVGYEERRAAREHLCFWCGETITAGERYCRWASIDCGAMTIKMHLECSADQEEENDGDGFYPYEHKRPTMVGLDGDGI